MADYDVVLLIEQGLSPADAAQVRSLHDGLDDQVTYHVLMPLEDAAEQVAASMGSVSTGEMMPTASMGLATGMDGEQLEQLRQRCEDSAEQELAGTVAALQAVGATLGSRALVTGPPIDAVRDKVKEVDGREAIILTEPHVVAEFFHVDWTSRARRHLDVPVLHLLERENFDEQAGGAGEGVHGF